MYSSVVMPSWVACALMAACSAETKAIGFLQAVRAPPEAGAPSTVPLVAAGQAGEESAPRLVTHDG